MADKIEVKGTGGKAVTLPNDEFLNVKYVSDEILKKLNPSLAFDGLLPAIRTNARSVVWYEDKYSDSTDPLKKTARRRTSIGEFASVDITSLEQVTDQLKAFGFEVAFDEDVMLFEEKVDDLVRARNRIAYWLAEQINDEQGKALVRSKWGGNSDAADDATSGPRVRTASIAWTGSSADPVKDIIKAKKLLEDQAGYNYTLTDLYLATPDFYELYIYLVNKTQTVWQRDPMSGDVQVPGLAGVSIHQVRQPSSGFTNNSLNAGLGLDRGNPAGTVYWTADPRYEQGQGMMAHTYIDDRTHKLYYQFWFMQKVALKEPLSVLMLTKLS